MLQFHPFGLLAWIAVALCWTLAIVLFRVGMPGSVARKLAVLLVFEGVTLGSSDAGVAIWMVSPQDFYVQHPLFGTGQRIVHTLGDVGMLALYPPFLAAALQTRLTRVFGERSAQIALAGAALMLFLAVMLKPVPFGLSLLYLWMAATFLFALVASIHAWHVSRGVARSRALSFAIAFGIRDIGWTLVYSLALFEIWWGAQDLPLEHPINTVRILAYILGTLFAVPMIAYGILRTQLFDIDLRIRWTIKQSTVAAAAVALVFLLSEGAERFLSSELGNVAGLLAAAIVVFLLAPLQRFAERVATVAMPNTENTPEYAAFRKMQVYESAVSEALYGDGISQKERALLMHLRESLGISEADAEAIEYGLQQGTAPMEQTG
ncbi:MAG: hypothetical protein PVH90_10725 [Gammaproteobacteria bacterium]